MGLKDWETALGDIDKAIEAHHEDFSHAVDRPCESMVEMQRVRAIVLEQLGRADEAKTAKGNAAIPATTYSETPYEQFHEKLKDLGAKHH